MDMLEKVGALLRKAESTEFAEEADALLMKAAALMEKYSIDEHEARTSGPRSAAEKPVTIEYEYSRSDSNARGKAALLNVAGKLCGVRMVNGYNGRGQHRGRVREDGSECGVASQWGYLVGFKDDIERTIFLFNSLLLQQASAGGRDWRQVEAMAPAGKSKFFTAHMFGFASGVVEKWGALEYDRRKAERGGTGSRALVLVDRDTQVQDALSERFPSLSRSSMRVGFGAAQGRAAGRQANLGQRGLKK